MKVQSLAVIFAIIILPVIIILSYYIHAEVDTIALQTSYDTKLIDATHDAMASFELNTANENLSSVSDALRSIIEASTNVFFNSLATNLGMSNASKDYVQPYIPAILYTLYDGYYIYSPTRVPEVLTVNGDTVVYVGDGGVDADGTITTDTGKNIGKYRWTEGSYSEGGNASIYSSLANGYEFGQMLYKNNDGSYSTELHSVSGGSNQGTYYKQDYVLKSYMPYSARYKPETGSGYDLTINYTLDNYLTIMGYIGDIYYSKTGYLIAKDTLAEADITVDGSATDLLKKNEIEAEEYVLSGAHEIKIKIDPFLEDGETRYSAKNSGGKIELESVVSLGDDGQPLSYHDQRDKLTRLYDEIEELYANSRQTGTDNSSAINSKNAEIQDIEYRLENLAAIAYYVKAQIFSNWVYNNLGSAGLDIKESNISDDLADLNNENYTTELTADGDSTPVFHHDFSDSDLTIFDDTQNPENISSIFVSHKFDVIRNSIQYNLNLALSIYDRMAGEMDIRMPVMSDSEWEKILQNVSIVSFMQGFNCGLKYYNNYSIVSSTNNELTVIPNEIYYVKKEQYNTEEADHIFHRIDCDSLEDTDSLISFRSKEVKYDKIYSKDTGYYRYDHKNFACYRCIVGNNYEKDVYDDSGAVVRGYNDKILVSTLSANHMKAYYRAVAKARENIYKTNALTDSCGYEELNISGINKNFTNNISVAVTSVRPVGEIRAIEVTIKDVVTSDADASSARFHAVLNSSLNIDGVELGINIQSTPQTIVIPVNTTDCENTTTNLNQIQLNKVYPDGTITGELLNIRVIYE